MSIRNTAIQCSAMAGIATLVNIPIAIFLFSSFMDRMVFYATSALHIYGDEAIGDFLVNAAFFPSLCVAILVALIATRFVQWSSGDVRMSNDVHQDQFFPQILFRRPWTNHNPVITAPPHNAFRAACGENSVPHAPSNIHSPAFPHTLRRGETFVRYEGLSYLSNMCSV
ncbi:hypothetical protein PQR53_38465 [Paraburkholderia fungorum]|uniref:hypothetical protein n=1 Tax=Paraburkholderia fungorum TaxID=134537 RepID=UPI0038B78973